MTSKERFLNFVNETQNKPYFSTLYDQDMWREDREKIANDLEVLEILKKYFTYWHVKDSKSVVIEFCNEPVIRIDEEDLEYGRCYEDDLKIKEWLENDKKDVKEN